MAATPFEYTWVAHPRSVLRGDAGGSANVVSVPVAAAKTTALAPAAPGAVGGSTAAAASPLLDLFDEPVVTIEEPEVSKEGDGEDGSGGDDEDGGDETGKEADDDNDGAAEAEAAAATAQDINVPVVVELGGWSPPDARTDDLLVTASVLTAPGAVSEGDGSATGLHHTDSWITVETSGAALANRAGHCAVTLGTSGSKVWVYGGEPVSCFASDAASPFLGDAAILDFSATGLTAGKDKATATWLPLPAAVPEGKVAPRSGASAVAVTLAELPEARDLEAEAEAAEAAAAGKKAPAKKAKGGGAKGGGGKGKAKGKGKGKGAADDEEEDAGPYECILMFGGRLQAGTEAHCFSNELWLHRPDKGTWILPEVQSTHTYPHLGQPPVHSSPRWFAV